MPSVEKNDVDISKLFSYGSKFDINFRSNSVPVYIRLVGDAELNRARVFAIRNSASLREKLNTANTDERVAFIPQKETAEREVLIGSILSLSIQGFTREALKYAPIPAIPTEPKGDAELEELENYQKKIDSYPLERANVIQEYVVHQLDLERERLNKLSDSDVYDTYVKMVINDLCEQEMMKRFREMCAYFGSYKDAKYTKPFFTGFEQFDNLPTEVKEQFINNYASLDIGTDELKK